MSFVLDVADETRRRWCRCCCRWLSVESSWSSWSSYGDVCPGDKTAEECGTRSGRCSSLCVISSLCISCRYIYEYRHRCRRRTCAWFEYLSWIRQVRLGYHLEGCRFIAGKVAVTVSPRPNASGHCLRSMDFAPIAIPSRRPRSESSSRTDHASI